MTEEKWWCFACGEWHPRSVVCSVVARLYDCEPYCSYRGWIEEGDLEARVMQVTENEK